MSDRSESVHESKSAVNSAKTEVGKGASQFQDNRPETSNLIQLQAIANGSQHVQNTAQLQSTANQIEQTAVIQPKKNDTGLPDNLKSGIENLSGMSMDDVKVHRNSDKPAQLNAHAYAQGTDIHLASGQEKHLPHEAWHVVQQKQGRVKPTMQMKGNPSTELRAGVNVNDDVGLEKEADVMGEKALKGKEQSRSHTSHSVESNVIQGVFVQDPANEKQTSSHGGVKADYTYSTNLVEFHIAPGANDKKKLPQDFLIALWEARDALTAGENRVPVGVPGSIFMRPGGAKALKMTMDILGEAFGGGDLLDTARSAKGLRKKVDAPLGIGIPEENRDLTLDNTFVPEHLAYRDSMIGTAGVEMKPAGSVGSGTSGGTVDMLQDNVAGAAERLAYDAALMRLHKQMTIVTTLTLPAVTSLITSIEASISSIKIIALKAKFKVFG